jgi:hypothetical protein
MLQPQSQGTAMARPKTADFDSTRLRLPPELHQQLKAAGEAAGRSMNAEILYRLECTFDPQIAEMIAGVEEQKEHDRKLKEINRRREELLEELSRLDPELAQRLRQEDAQ